MRLRVLTTIVLLLASAFFVGSVRAQTNDQRSLILVVGAAGEPEFGDQFAAWADLWKQAASKGGVQTTVIGEDQAATPDDRAHLLSALETETAKPAGELWIVLLGHGTFDGHAGKFNLRGPDISADDLASALKPCQRPLVVINCFSSSGPFLTALSGKGRVVITSTRSGSEVNFSHFGEYLAHTIADPAADLDKDGQTSLLEAFLLASRQMNDFYKTAGRLATEHPLLDDNGDKQGTPPDWFHGVRAVKTAANGKSVDGIRAHQMILVRGAAEEKLAIADRTRRDELETKLNTLRSRKSSMDEDEYYDQVESIMVETARLYEPAKTP